MASTIHVILASGFKGATELSLNVVTSGVLEGLFPPFDPKRSPWLNLIEGTVEIALYLLLAGTASNAFDELLGGYPLARLPYGSLLMFWLLDGAVAKVMHFVNYIAAKMNIRRVPAKPLVIESESEHSRTQKESMDTSNTSTHSDSCGTSSCSQ